MNDPRIVRGFQCFRDLLRNRQGLVDCNRTTRKAL
jgi:hypothetical protein